MPDLIRTSLAAAALIAAAALGGCGESQPKPDPAVVDQHLKQLIAREEAEQRRLVEEARAREDVREQEMKQREDNYSDGVDAGANASTNEAAPQPD